MELSQLLSAITVRNKTAHKNQRINKVVYHSKNCTPNTLFVCIEGYETDGHEYAEEAVKNGAVALVVERFLPEVAALQYLVDDSRQALAALSDEFYGHPSEDLSIVGVTATNGKTTTTYMIDAIFEEYGWETGLIGTVMVKYGDKITPSVLTTPESSDLHAYLDKMRKEDVSHVSMEVSSSALDLKRVGNIAYDIVALNNISPDHIDLHGSFEAYYNAKASLIRDAGADQTAVLNLDDDYSSALQTQTEASVVTYGIDKSDGNISIRDLRLNARGADFIVEISRPFHTVKGQVIEAQSFPLSVSMMGYHSVYNALAAVTIGLISGVSISSIQKGIKAFKGVERRFQIIYDREFTIVDDFFVNKDNIEATLETLNQLDYDQLRLVYAVRGNRGVKTNRENARLLARRLPELGVNRIILTTSDSHMRKKDKVKDEELQVVVEELQKAGLDIDFHKEMPAALDAGLEMTKPKDVLLLAGGKGMDFAAKYILNEILDKNPELDKETILRPLKNRMAGMDESVLEGKTIKV